MVHSCFVLGCKRDTIKNPDTSFHKIPGVISDRNKKFAKPVGAHCLREVIELSKIRQREWIKAIRRRDLSESKLKNIKVCSDHFISGKPAELTDRYNPDWVPCQNLGYTSEIVLKNKSALEQHTRFLKSNVTTISPNISTFKTAQGNDQNLCIHCNKTFHFADATVKADHSICWNMSKVKAENTNEDTRTEPPNISVQNSPEIVQPLPKKMKENLSSPSTSKSSPTSTSANASTPTLTNLQNSTTDSSPFQANVSFTDEERTVKLHELLARVIYTTAMPMDLTENCYWKKFLHVIRPSYIPPSVQDLRGYLLEMEYKRVMAAAQRKVLSASSLVLVSYGWANPRGKIHFVVATPEPVYVKCIVSKTEKDVDYISQKIKNVIKKVGDDKLMLLLTDNGPNMTEALDIVSKTYPHVTVSRSGADDVKLLLRDIMKVKSLQDLLKKAKEMLLSIGEDCRESEEVCSPNRWGTIPILKTLLEKKSAFQVDLAPDEMMPEEVRRKILDEDMEFWIEAQQLLDLLNCISQSINTLETDQTLLSDVPNVFAGIQVKVLDLVKNSSILDKEKYDIYQFFEAREKSCVKPIHKAANLLDPRYRGLGLNSEDIESAINFLTKQCKRIGLSAGNFMSNLDDYRNSRAFYSKTYLWGTAKHLSPQEWWRNFCPNEPLCRLAKQLLCVNPSSAAYQKIFKRIEMNPRHGLGSNGLEKLITIKSNLFNNMAANQETLTSMIKYEMEIS